MKIRTNEELNIFENVIGKCSKPVLVLASDGRQYDLKDPMEYHSAISLLVEDCPGDTDIYANCTQDELYLFAALKKIDELRCA